MPKDPLDIPDFLKISAAERHKAWEKNPPKAMPLFAYEQKTFEISDELRQMQEEQKRRKTEKSLLKLKNHQAAKAERDKGQQPGMIWDFVRGGWKPDPNYVPPADGVIVRASGLVQKSTPAKPQLSAKTARDRKTGQPRASQSKDNLAAEVAAYTHSKDGTFDTARLVKFAKANGVWDDKYKSLNNGLQRMNVVNRLRGKIRSNPKFKVAWP